MTLYSMRNNNKILLNLNFGFILQQQQHEYWYYRFTTHSESSRPHGACTPKLFEITLICAPDPATDAVRDNET